MTDLKQRSSHFEFGENWKDYAKSIDHDRIASAVDGLKKLFPDGLHGKSFTDIGCGSGVHSLAALSLGAAHVTAIDIDENSVETTRSLLSAHAKGDNWTANIVSIFDIPADLIGKFDVVYSWGVLHHTGDMWPAIENATSLVAPGGQFAIAIYAKTPMDPAWKIEKRIYANAPKLVQMMIRKTYTGALLAGLALKGRNVGASVSEYKQHRGMNFHHDIHDWLGGYPYETASAEELQTRIEAMGFTEERSFRMQIKLAGLLGSGCHEHVFRKSPK